MAATTTRKTKPAHVRRGGHKPPSFAHPHSVPILASDEETGPMPDQPFAEGAEDPVDPDFRHRLISETAYMRYVERGYADGYDLDDWLQAETEIDHVLISRPGGLD